MNPTKPKKVARTLLLPLFVLLIVPAAARAQTNTPEEKSCFNMVQGKVAWNTAGTTTWQEGNIRNLCKGTINPSATVSCFKSKIASGQDWSQATAACSPSVLNSQPRKNAAALLQEEIVVESSPAPAAPIKIAFWNYASNPAKLRVFRADQPLEQNPVAEGTVSITLGDKGDTVLPADFPIDQLVVEVRMTVFGGYVPIYRATVVPNGEREFCFEGTGSAYVPVVKPCKKTQAVEAKRISFKNESGLTVKMNLDYVALDNTAKTITTDDTVLGMSRAIFVPRDAAPGRAMTLTVNAVGTLLKHPLLSTKLLPSSIKDSTCFKAWGPVITPKASPCSITPGARTIKLMNNGGYNTMMEVVYNDGGETTVRTNIIELLQSDTIEIPYSAPNVPIQVKLYSDPPLKVFSTNTINSSFTGQLCYRTEGTIFSPVVSNCDNSVGDAASSDVRQIRFQNDSGFDAQMTVTYFVNEMVNGNSIPMLKTAASGFINGLSGKFRLINIPKETTPGMPISVWLTGSTTVKDQIFFTTLPENFAASPQPCFKVWGTLFNPGGGTCNQ
jgi:hypothetical protein